MVLFCRSARRFLQREVVSREQPSTMGGQALPPLSKLRIAARPSHPWPLVLVGFRFFLRFRPLSLSLVVFNHPWLQIVRACAYFPRPGCDPSLRPARFSFFSLPLVCFCPTKMQMF